MIFINSSPEPGSAVAWWLMPLTPDPEVGGSSPTRILEQGTFTPKKVLVIPRKRWERPNMTEKLFTGTLRINQSSSPDGERIVYQSSCRLSVCVSVNISNLNISATSGPIVTKFYSETSLGWVIDCIRFWTR